jgi:AraC-like DNA-binding protein
MVSIPAKVRRPSTEPGLRSRSPRGATAATPIAFVRAILRAYERYGESPAEVLREAQISPELLRDPEGRITARQMEIVSEGAMRQLDDEALGWFSRKLPWGSLGMLCRASLPSPDLGVALKRWFRHHRLLTEDVDLVLGSSPGAARVSIRENRDLGGMREFCLLSYLRYVHGYACWAVDSRISLLGVGFPFEPPPHGSAYALMFPGPVSFGAREAHFTFDPKYLSLPQRRDDAALRAMLQRALPLTVLQYRRDRLLVPRIQALFAADPSILHDAASVARALHVSTRSLHRHLREEGASLQALKDEVRRDRAIELLCRTQKPVKQVARAVGFESEKSFSRAFRGWTGRSPRQVRREGPRAGAARAGGPRG